MSIPEDSPSAHPIPDEGDTHHCEFELCGKEFVAEAAGQTMCSWSCVADSAFNAMFDGRDGSLESKADPYVDDWSAE